MASKTQREALSGWGKRERERERAIFDGATFLIPLSYYRGFPADPIRIPQELEHKVGAILRVSPGDPL